MVFPQSSDEKSGYARSTLSVLQRELRSVKHVGTERRGTRALRMFRNEYQTLLEILGDGNVSNGLFLYLRSIDMYKAV